MARLIGDAYIVIYPQTDGFGTQAKADVEKALSALKPNVNIRPELDKGAAAAVKAALEDIGADVNIGTSVSSAELAALKAKIDAALKGTNSTSKVNVATGAAADQIDYLVTRTQALSAELGKLRANVDDDQALADISALAVKADALDKALRKAGDGTDLAPLEARMLAIQAAFNKISSAKFKLDASAAEGALVALAERTGELRLQLDNLRIRTDNSAALAQIAALQAQAVKLSRALVLAPKDADVAPLEADLLKLQTGAEKAAQGLDDAATAADNAGKKAKSSLGGWTSLGSAVNKVASIHIPLFATSLHAADEESSIMDRGLTVLGENFITSASGVHLAIEAVVEFTAIWGPALLAMSIFVAAATPTALKFAQQLQNMATTSEATGKQFDTLKASTHSMVTAIQPQVMQLFGETLIAASEGSGQLNSKMQDLGGVLDKFGAMVDKALSSPGTGKFLEKASSDVAGLGDAFIQIGRIIGSLLKDVPGYAEILLKLGDAALTMSADIVQAINPVIKYFLLLHGAVFYIGLATTIVGTFGKAAVTAFTQVAAGGEKATEAEGKLSKLGQSVGNLAGGLVSGISGFGKGVANFAGLAKNYVGEIGDIGKESGIAKAGTTVLGDAMEALPFGPAGLAAGAAAAVIGGILYLAFTHTTTAAQKFNAQLQDTIAASNYANIQQNLKDAISQTSAKVTEAIQDQKTFESALTQTSEKIHGQGVVQSQASQFVDQYRQGLTKVEQEQVNYNVRLAATAATYGGVQAATELATLAGVKAGDMAKENASQWAATQFQLEATAKAYGIVNEQGGALGHQLDTLSISTGTVTKATQTLTQAEAGWLSLVTGGDTAFTTFEQGMSTLKGALSGVSAETIKVGQSAGKLKESITVAGTSLDGTTDAALAARQAFDSQIQAAGTLYGNLQDLAAASGNTDKAQTQLTQAGKDLVAQLLPLAQGSKTATSEVYALAQVVGYDGPNSFSALSKWLGNTKGAEKDLDKQTQDLTESSANLTQAAKNLSQAIGSDITAAEAAAITKTQGFTQDTTNLANAIVQSRGAASDAVKEYAGNFYEALIQAGDGAIDAKNQVDTFLQHLGATPGTVATVNAALAKLPKNVAIGVTVTTTGNGNVVITGSGIPTKILTTSGTVEGGGGKTLATGGVVPGGIHGRDSVHTMLAPGELVIPSSHAAKFGDMARKASIPGFASGGLVGSIAAAQQGTASSAALFGDLATIAFAQASIAAAQAAAAAAGIPGNVASYKPVVDAVLGKLGLPKVDDSVVLKQMTTESEGNPLAVNLTDSNAKAGHPSVGLMQVIAGTFDAYAGPYRNTGPFLYGVSTNPTANIYAGVNYATHAYGGDWTSVLGQGHGYGRGGPVKRHSAGGMVSEPVFGVGMSSGRGYSFAEHAPEYVGPLSGNGVGNSGLPPMTQYQAGQLIMEQQRTNKLLQQMPYAYASALQGAAGQGVRRGAFATGG